MTVMMRIDNIMIFIVNGSDDQQRMSSLMGNVRAEEVCEHTKTVNIGVSI